MSKTAQPAPRPASISRTARAATARPNGRAASSAENMLTTSDLIWPMFLIDGAQARIPVAAMPGVDRLSVDEAVREAKRAVKLDIPAIAFFPYTEASAKDETAARRSTAESLCAPCRAIKKAVPRSASSPTSRSIPTPATATTA